MSDPNKSVPPSGGCYGCGRQVRTWKRGLGWYCHRCARIEYRVQGVPVAERRYQPGHAEHR